MQENKILIKVSRSKNRHDVHKNIVYFLNKIYKALNWIIVWQHYINNEVCANAESFQHTVPNHTNRKKETPLYVIKKSTISDSKK